MPIVLNSRPDSNTSEQESTRHVDVTPVPGSEVVQVRGATPEEVVDALSANPALDVEPRPGGPGSGSANTADLTEREIEILRYIAAGLSNTELGGAMYLSVNTVKSHIRSAYRKIGVETRSQAVRWALEHGLTEPPAGPHN